MSDYSYRASNTTLYCSACRKPFHVGKKGHECASSSTEDAMADQEAKKDAGKLPMELLSPVAMEELAKVLAFGAKKYSANGWRKSSPSFTRILAAVLRHTFSYLGGETHDPETGLSHMAHVMTEAMFLVELEKTKPQLDDRYKQEA